LRILVIDDNDYRCYTFFLWID